MTSLETLGQSIGTGQGNYRDSKDGAVSSVTNYVLLWLHQIALNMCVITVLFNVL